MAHLKRLMIFTFCLIIIISFASAYNFPVDEEYDIASAINYTTISVNDSTYWDGNAWSDTRWLEINGSNANTNIDINDFNFSAGWGFFEGNLMPLTSLLYDIGSGLLRWGNLYVSDISADDISAYDITAHNIDVSGEITSPLGNFTDLFAGGINLTNISNLYVPYIGATSNVDLGIYNITGDYGFFNELNISKAIHLPADVELYFGDTDDSIFYQSLDNDFHFAGTGITYLTTTEGLFNFTGSNIDMFGGNVTADNFFGNLTWTDLNNYPVACPAGSAITQLNDSVTCTSFLQSSSSGQDLTNLSLSKGLVAFYPFSTGARDLSGQGNDGTVIGATHNGIGGFNGAGAYEFDGVNDYVDCGDMDETEDVSELTISVWVKPQDVTSLGAGAGILGKSVNNDYRYGIFCAGSSEHIYLQMSNNSNAYGRANNVIHSGEWSHLVMVYNGNGATDADKIKFYYNSDEQSLSYGGTIASTIPILSNNFLIGRQQNKPFFNGSIDEAMMFNRSLSAEEVKRLYELRPHETSTIFDENVGIGTTTPQNKLNVIGDGNFTGDLYVTANFTLGQKITFALGETIDNIVDGWVRITGSLNVTGNADVIGNFTAGTIQADNGYTGFCVNTTFVGGIATACND